MHQRLGAKGGDVELTPDLLRALALLPTARFILTASNGDERGGYPVRWVTQAARTPVCIAAAIEKGHPTVPIVRDSRAFGICMLRPDDTRTFRRFELAAETGREPGNGSLGDPFDTLAIETAITGSPLLRASALAFDCELCSHVDFDADHELYVGRIVAARVYTPPKR